MQKGFTQAEGTSRSMPARLTSSASEQTPVQGKRPRTRYLQAPTQCVTLPCVTHIAGCFKAGCFKALHLQMAYPSTPLRSQLLPCRGTPSF